MAKSSEKNNAKAKSVRQIMHDFYAVNPPFAYVGIFESEEGKLKYVVIEPTLSKEEKEAIEKIKRYLLEDRSIDLDVLRGVASLEDFIREQSLKIIKKRKIKLDEKSLNKVLYYVLRDVLGYGKIDVMIRDPNVEDISCDGVKLPVYVWHRNYESLPSNVVFESKEELDSFIERLAYKAGKQISIANPIVEGSLPEGYRIHLTLSEISRRGSTFTIRKFRENPYTIIDLINFGTFSIELVAYLWYLIDEKRSIMIGGATAAGKTTALNALAMLIMPEAKIVTIEETPELRLPHENWIPLVARPAADRWVMNVTLFELLKSALRMRPDYIIVGEVRGEEAYTLFQSIATGHAGMCTIHAENVDYALKRLQTHPMNVPKILIPMMNVYLQMMRVRFEDGRIARRVVGVYELLGLDPDTGEIIVNKVFEWNPLEDRIYKVGESQLLRRIAAAKFLDVSRINDELERRATIIEYMAERKMNSFEDVSRIVREYYYKGEEVVSRARLGVL